MGLRKEISFGLNCFTEMNIEYRRCSRVVKNKKKIKESLTLKSHFFGNMEILKLIKKSK